MSKLLLTALAAVVLVAPAFAQGATPNGTNIDTSYDPGTVANQGVYFATAPQQTASQDVSVAITPYSHVNLLNTAAANVTVTPGGTGNNQVRIDNSLRYATNRDVKEGNVVQVRVDGASGSAEFDELNFLVRSRAFSPTTGTQTVIEDIATDGSKGTVGGPFGDRIFTMSNNGIDRDFITGFGQVVAVEAIRYDITVSDVAQQGTRNFDVTFTISPF